MDVGVDRISELPESLIQHILFFLPTKLAVSTTVLSKRWNNLWISMPVLDFREWQTITHCPRGENPSMKKLYLNRFMSFLDRTLLSNKTTTSIQKFCLACDYPQFCEKRMKEWIIALIRRKVQELILTVTTSKLVPLEIFTCESLSMLDISFDRNYVLHFPQSISLPRLKVLRLSRTYFKDMACMQQFFSNCPILEELILCKCRGRGDITSSAIHSSTLDSLSNFVRISSNIKLLKVSCDYLQFFNIANVPSTSSPTYNNLVCLEVDYDEFHNIRPSISWLFNFLRFSPNLDSLVVNRVHNTRELIYGEDVTLNIIPHCFLLHLKLIEFQTFNGSPGEFELVKLFLNYAQVLNQLVVMNRSRYSSAKMIRKLQMVPRASTDCSFQVIDAKHT